MLIRKPTPASARRSARGVTLIEVMAFLAVSGVVIASVVALSALAFESAKVSSTQMEFEALRTAIKKLSVGRSEYTGVTIDQLVAADALPATLKVNGSTVVNQWGGGVGAAASAWGPDRFVIGYGNVPRAACVDLLTSFSRAHWITVAAGDGGLQNPTPISPATATARCLNSNTIVAQSRN